MATNPRIPQQEPPRLQLQPRSRVPWVLIALIAAAALLVALILWLPRTPRAQMAPNAAQVPQQPTGSQIQFTNMNITPAPTGNVVRLQGRMVNMGSTDLTGAIVAATFLGANGQPVGTVQAPVMGVEGGSNSADQPLTDAPIKPSEARIVRMDFANVPAGWNKQLPSLQVVTVTAAGQPVSPAGQPPILNEQNNQNSQSQKNPPQNGATNAGQMGSPQSQPAAGARQPVKGQKPANPQPQGATPHR